MQGWSASGEGPGSRVGDGRPSVSVVIPTLNEERWLPRLLRSLASQTRPPLEVIVSDSGSHDATTDIAADAGCAVVIGPRAGPGAGRNLGASSARGDLLLFLDADVELPTAEFLERAVDAFVRSRLVIAGMGFRPLERGLSYRLAFRLIWMAQRCTRPVAVHAGGYALLGRRDLHEHIGGFDETLPICEDDDYCRRMAEHGKFGFLKGVYVMLSARRLQRHGILKTGCVYFKWWVTQMLRMKKHRPFYPFGHYGDAQEHDRTAPHP